MLIQLLEVIQDVPWNDYLANTSTKSSRVTVPCYRLTVWDLLQKEFIRLR